MYEVEMKYRVRDVSALERHLAQYGVAFLEVEEESDQFYRHPAKDFRQTDEALRLRTRKTPSQTERTLTYKGPKIDVATKTRREIEIPLDTNAPWHDMLTALGFVVGGNVHKFRRHGVLDWKGVKVTVVLDTLPVLPPSEQHFVELEVLVCKSDWNSARDTVLEVAKALELTEGIRVSYLELTEQNRHLS